MPEILRELLRTLNVPLPYIIHPLATLLEAKSQRLVFVPQLCGDELPEAPRQRRTLPSSAPEGPAGLGIIGTLRSPPQRAGDRRLESVALRPPRAWPPSLGERSHEQLAMGRGGGGGAGPEANLQGYRAEAESGKCSA